MIRTRSIVLQNVKNAAYGKVEFKQKRYGSSIAGIYGQNGSGKTAVVDAFACAQMLLRGQKLSPESADLIGPESDEAAIELEFEISQGTSEALGFAEGFGAELANEKVLCVDYVFAFRKMDEGVALSSESISVKAKGLAKRTLLAYSREDRAFRPQARWRALKALAGADASLDLVVAQRSEERASASLVFSAALDGFAVSARMAYKEGSEGEGMLSHAAQEAYEKTLKPLMDIVTLLREFASSKLEIFGSTYGPSLTSNAFVLPASAAPHRLWAQADGKARSEKSSLGNICCLPDKASVVPVSFYKALVSTAELENKVLSSIIPGLAIEIRKLNDETMDNGAPGVRIEALSCRENAKIPFRCESEGIKKIVSLLGGLLDVYGDENVCLVIDGMDSGIFEYLLGELVEMLAVFGKGQLIFTAHDLRALECFPAICLVSTTMNPYDRYIKFEDTGASGNLRSHYLRAINLGGQKEQISAPTDERAMNAAFYQACKSQYPKHHSAAHDEAL